MSDLENFINHVDGIVATNKLSSSAVDRAKQLSEACYSSPLALTGALLKSHLKVTPKSALSSFYIFDAIARNAHDHVRRAAKAGSAASSDKASQAEAWLSSAEGIAEELTSTTLAKVPDSQKDKVKKVVDIWTKTGTFSEDALEVVKASIADLEPSRKDTPNTAYTPNERLHSPAVRSTPPISGPLAPPAVSVPAGLPANLAALLGAPSTSTTQSSAPQSAEHLLSSLSSLISQGTSGASGSTGPSVSNAAAMIPSVPSSINQASHFHPAGPMSSVAGNSPAARPSDWSAAPQSFSSTSEPHVGTPPLGHGESGDGGWQGRAARGIGRGRGRGGTGYHGSPGHAQYNESTIRSPVSAQRRSASPPGGVSRARYPDRGGPGAAAPSRSPPAGGAAKGGYGPGSNSKDGSGGQKDSSVGDLSMFDPSTFDPTDPASLDRLAKMYHNTYQYYPSAPEMMWLVGMMMMGGGMGMDPSSMGMGMGMGMMGNQNGGDQGWGGDAAGGWQ